MRERPAVNASSAISDEACCFSAILFAVIFLWGLRSIPFGNFLIKQVVAELAAEFPNIQRHSTLSVLDRHSEDSFTKDHLSRLLAGHAQSLIQAARQADAVEAIFQLLKQPLQYRDILAVPLRCPAFAYFTLARNDGKLCNSVASRESQRFRQSAVPWCEGLVRHDRQLPIFA